jgi:hypothetical protein
MDTYTLSQAAGILGIENLGRQKIYIILKELGIVDKYNRPVQKYIYAGYFIPGTPLICQFRQTYVTLVVGKIGLGFLKRNVIQYLKENSLPKITRSKRFTGMNI